MPSRGSGALKVTRVYTREDGSTAFEDVELLVDDDFTAPQPAASATFRRFPPGTSYERHPSPNRMYVVTLSGHADVGVSDDQTRRIGPGDILLYEDTTGSGHSTRVVGDDDRVTVTINLP